MPDVDVSVARHQVEAGAGGDTQRDVGPQRERGQIPRVRRTDADRVPLVVCRKDNTGDRGAGLRVLEDRGGRDDGRHPAVGALDRADVTAVEIDLDLRIRPGIPGLVMLFMAPQ